MYTEVKIVCESLREQVMKIIYFKSKKMKSLTKEQQESYENAKICYIFKEKFENKYLKGKNIVKLEIIVVILGNTEDLRIACVI